MHIRVHIQQMLLRDLCSMMLAISAVSHNRALRMLLSELSVTGNVLAPWKTVVAYVTCVTYIVP